MGQFVGNPDENLCMTAARGRWFVPVERENTKIYVHTKRGKILAGVSVAVLVVLILGAILLLSANKIVLPKYNKLCGALGGSADEVEKVIPKEVNYVGATFAIEPHYEDHALRGFSYTATIEDSEAGAKMAVKILKRMYRVMDQPIFAKIDEEALTQAAIMKALKRDSALYWKWDAAKHSPESVDDYRRELYASESVMPDFTLRVRVEKLAIGVLVAMEFTTE